MEGEATMAAQESVRTSAGRQGLRAVLLASLLALSLVASVLLVPRVTAAGQSSAGFAEVGLTDAEQFQVMGSNYVVRTNLTFGVSEVLRVNVTSATVDWAGNAAGRGSRDLILQRFEGTPMATVSLTEVAGGPPFVYSASIDLSTLTLVPDSYYLRIFIDDTVNTFEATSIVRLGVPAVAHLLETFTDDTFTQPSDMFTPTSTVWIRAVGLPAADPDRWDIGAYLNGASVVNGPNTNFANFQRAGTEYTFSIDLANWQLNFVQGWSYTLNVRLAGGAFDAGKQIQIFSPTLSVAGTDLAPTTARQGQTGVPMLGLSLSLNANWGTLLAPGAFNLDRIRVTRTGSGTGADISGVHLYEDVNGNGAVDAGDVLLASAMNPGGLTFPLWLGQNGVPMAYVTSSGPLPLIVTYDIAPRAVVGDTVGAQIASAADVALEGTFAGITGLPVGSGNVLIAGATVLTVTNTPGVAPGSAGQNQPNVPIDLLRLSTNGPAMTVSAVTVTLAGTGAPADVASVSLHLDNGDGLYEPALDPVRGSPTTFTSGGLAVFTGLALPIDSTGRALWIVYDISASALVGDRVGSSLPSNASIAVLSGSVYNGTFPLDSALVRISGPILTVTWRNLAPAQAIQGRTNLPMLELTLSVDFGQSTVSGFRIDKRGTSTLDTDVPFAKIWLDANGDGIFDSGDLLLGSQGFVGGTTVIGGLSLSVGASRPRTLFVTFDIAATATPGVTVSARLATPAYVSVDASTTVRNENFPVISAAVLIAAPSSGAFLTVGSADLAQWYPQVYEGQLDVPMEKLYLTVDQNSGLVTGMHINKIGTSTLDADVAAIKLYRDADGDGNFSVADQLLTRSTFVGGIAIFSNLNLTVRFNQPVMLFIVIDVSPTASLGKTVAVYLGNHVNIAANGTTTVDPNSFPIQSSEVAIAAASLRGIVRDANGNPIANATVFLPQLNRTATTDPNGNYAFGNLPLGLWTVIARAPGYQEGNRTVNLTSAAPNGNLDFSLSPVPPTVTPGTFVAIAVGGGLLALLLLGLMLLFVVRRRSRCPICGKPKGKDEEVCPECKAKGLHPPGSSPPTPPPQLPAAPPPPPSASPAVPASPGFPKDDL